MFVCCFFYSGQHTAAGDDRLSSSVGSVQNPFLSSTSPSVQGVPLENFGTNLIYRDVNELTTLNKVRVKGRKYWGSW